MTTFQVLMEALFRALTRLIPISPAVNESLSSRLMHWSVPVQELEFLVLLTGSLTLLFFFRFDWLGILSAALTTTFKPLSLKPDRRTLDQHTLLFLLTVFLPSFLCSHFLKPFLQENEALSHPLLAGGLTLLLAFGLNFSHRWNKRIFGLNHLKLVHGLLIATLTLLSAHPALPLIGLLWIGFALNNYHYEAVYKYSMLILGLHLFTTTLTLLGHTGLRAAFEQLGALNSLAILALSFTVFWIGLENLQKSLSEATFKTFQWLNVGVAIYFAVLYFLPA
jgi:undecaprenyl pyrophosphate phosphatase UppP